MLTSGGGGTFYWVRNEDETTPSSSKIEGIVVIFAWGSLQDCHLKNYVNLYSSLGWNSLLVLSDFLNPFFPEKATSLAFSVLNELLEELRTRPSPLVLASLSGGSQACMYKVFQIIEGTCEAHLNLDDSRLIMTCISGQMYDSGPVNVTGDLGARFALHSSVLNLPGSSKLVSLVAKGVTSGLDALFLTRFASQRSEYWQTLYSSVGLGAPFLILCSENDDLAPYPVICSFAQQVQGLGGHVRLIGWKDSPHVGHYKHNPIQYRAAVTEFLEHSVLIFNQKLEKLGERCGMGGMHDKIYELICDLQNAAVDSNQSLRRVAVGPNDHFFLPSSETGKESGSLQDEQKERRGVHLAGPPPPPTLNPHGVLGQVLFDVCVPKNIEGWDIKFDKRQPFASARKRSSLNALKRMRRSRL
ncbi:hypothetical protein L6452_00981 [Arctium lappa]|uniref:Uncharacterized protein n=1 Tax=Arctium lappa TaxID=4217 RepID=A0ACB9FFM5_ARCLA|nr:hypothetical protein L6452_00981 [Arctium lappa]